MGEWLHFPIRFVAAKSDDDPGSLEGYASVYNVIDQQDEVVARGAFKRTLAAWKSSGRRIPLTADHETSGDGVIGSADVAEEDNYGLRMRFTFSSDPRAQALRIKAREGHLTGLSIFGEAVHKSTRVLGGQARQLLEEIRLMAVGLTPFPANGLAAGVAKADLPQAAPSDEVWMADLRAALTITTAAVRKSAVDALVATRYPVQQATTEPAAGDTADAENTDDQVDDAAKYALGIIGESGPGVSPPGGNPSDNSLADLLAPLETAGTNTELDALEAELKQMGQTA
jgi:HK97 family phage prohead protease